MTVRILVTRPAGQGEELCRALSGHGLDAVHIPAVAIDIPATNPELDAALANIERYAWLVVTSANGARAVTEALRRAPATGRVRMSKSARMTTAWPTRLTAKAPPGPMSRIATPASGGRNA